MNRRIYFGVLWSKILWIWIFVKICDKKRNGNTFITIFISCPKYYTCPKKQHSPHHFVSFVECNFKISFKIQNTRLNLAAIINLPLFYILNFLYWSINILKNQRMLLLSKLDFIHWKSVMFTLWKYEMCYIHSLKTTNNCNILLCIVNPRCLWLSFYLWYDVGKGESRVQAMLKAWNSPVSAGTTHSGT